jgi:ADP-ribosylglycohydrolase
MLLELAVGDAYGAGFEYADRSIVETYNDLSGYVRRKTGEAQRVGRYTDDAQMSLAIAEAIVSGEPWTPRMLADRFVEAYRRDPRFGYAARFHDFLRTVRDGQDFLNRIVPASDKSGAAMRACPIGVYPTVAEVRERCTLQAKLTHDTPDGIAAACAAALMTHYCLYGIASKADMARWLEREAPGHRWADPWRGKVGSKGWMSVRAAITAVVAHDRLSDILRACIAFTGDVDTVATVALGAASCSAEVEQDIPAHLLDGLENATYGRDYLVELDTRLLALVARR